MHIHYNTNQTTLPSEISLFTPQDHLVFTIEKSGEYLGGTSLCTSHHAFNARLITLNVYLLLFAHSQGDFLVEN